MNHKILFLLFLVSFGGLCWTYGGYPIFIYLLAKLIKREHKCDDGYQPRVSFVVPTFNDEKIIEEKLKNISRLNYPKDRLETLIINDHSSDDTQHIVEDFVKNNKETKIILINQPKRSGNNDARNAGIKHASNDIIVFTDANALLDRDALRYSVRHFSDPRVGCVGAKYVNRVLIKSEVSVGGAIYHKIQDFKYKNEADIGCAHTSTGWFQLFRKDLLDPREERISAVDWDMTLCVKKKGYRVIYEPRAIAYKLPAATAHDLFHQMRRTLIGVAICISKYRSFFNPFKYGIFSICFSSNRVMQMLTPFFVISSFFTLCGIYMYQSSLLPNHIVLIGVAMFFIFLGAKSILRTTDYTVKVLSAVKFFVLMNIICLIAWYEFFSGNYSQIWQPIKTSRMKDQLLA